MDPVIRDARAKDMQAGIKRVQPWMEGFLKVAHRLNTPSVQATCNFTGNSD